MIGYEFMYSEIQWKDSMEMIVLFYRQPVN